MEHATVVLLDGNEQGCARERKTAAWRFLATIYGLHKRGGSGLQVHIPLHVARMICGSAHDLEVKRISVAVCGLERQCAPKTIIIRTGEPRSYTLSRKSPLQVCQSIPGGISPSSLIENLDNSSCLG